MRQPLSKRLTEVSLTPDQKKAHKAARSRFRAKQTDPPPKPKKNSRFDLLARADPKAQE